MAFLIEYQINAMSFGDGIYVAEAGQGRRNCVKKVYIGHCISFYKNRAIMIINGRSRDALLTGCNPASV